MAAARTNSLTASSPDGALADAPAPHSPRDTTELKVSVEAEECVNPSPGISILKEIFPEHGKEETTKDATPGKAVPPPLQQLLGSVPSPARVGIGNCIATVPRGPPAHAPTVVPAPPMQPAPVCQQQWAPPMAMAPRLLDPFSSNMGSYRERLRAGGRDAFQRAFDAGIVPKNMKQEWMPSGPTEGMARQFASDAHQMWGTGQMQSPDFCTSSMQQYGCMQQVAMPSQHMLQPQMPMLPQAAMQPQMHQMQMAPMAQGEQSPQMSQMMQLPQMAMSQVQTPTSGRSGDSTPTEIDNVRQQCMAMLMPHTQFLLDTDVLAAQLKASADDCQRYED